MIVQKGFLNKLKDFGLNSYESKLWTALLSRGTSTAGELSDIANVPRSRSYDVLESLEKKGFIIMKLGKPIKYIAVPPSEVLERVKRKIIEDTQKQTTTIDDIKKSNILTELQMLHSQGVSHIDPSTLSGVVRGRTNLYNQMETMINDAQESIIIMTTEEGLLRKANILGSALENAAKRGVSVKIAAPKKTKITLSKVDIKTIKKAEARFVVADNKEIMFMMMDDAEAHPNYDVAVWVKAALFADSLAGMFQQVLDAE